MTSAENLKDLLSHRYTRLIAVLANVSESSARRRVRVDCNDWNSAVHRFLHNIIKSSRIGHGSSDTIDVLRNSRLDKINLLLDIEVWRAGVSHFRTEQLPGVFSAFANRHEKPHGRGMTDDSKLILRKARLVRRFSACSENLRWLRLASIAASPSTATRALRATFISIGVVRG